MHTASYAYSRFNVLAKDLENAKELFKIAGDRVFVGVMVKNFPTNEAAIQQVKSYQAAGIQVSVGLGAGDPAMWKRVAEVSKETLPPHVNQVFPASGYTLGCLDNENTLINALVEPSGEVGKVYITTGPESKKIKDKVSCEAAATLLAEIGLNSIKFYPIKGDSKISEVAAMVKAAVKCGITTFEPTGGLTVENVHKVVQVCIDQGAKRVIPHLYTSLVNKENGKTEVEKLKTLIQMTWG
ncbi:oxo-acid lyase [Sporolactobacillus sp. THM7-7]|nr:oxo-acid lyase [Sporolactobacillus sp. THM7-7]